MGDQLDLLDAEEQRPAKRRKTPKSRHYSADAKVFLHRQTPCPPPPPPLPLPLHAPPHAPLHAQSPPLSQPDQEQAQLFASQTPLPGSSLAMAAADPAGGSTNTIVWPGCAPVFDPSWAWPMSAQETHPPATLFVTPPESVETNTFSPTGLPPQQHTLPAILADGGNTPSSMHSGILRPSRLIPHACTIEIHDLILQVEVHYLLCRDDEMTRYFFQNLICDTVTSASVNHDFSPLCHTDTAFLDDLNALDEPSPIKNFPEGKSTPAKPPFGQRQQVNVRPPFPNNHLIESPFRDCIGTFGLTRSQSFHRPTNGQVNGYIKFSWPKENDKKRTTPSRTSPVSQTSRITELDDASEPHDTATSSNCVVVNGPRDTSTTVRDVMPDFSIDFSTYVSQTADMGYNAFITPRSTPPSVHHHTIEEVASLGAPQLIPSQYGYEAKMDSTDRRFWMFYIRNWCPGRSVLEDTNLWLKDFAQMHKSIGVRSAIQSLAGIYIYDYQPLDSIRDRVNRRFQDAEKRFTQLLNDPATYRDESQANEMITIGVILSMQDIVLTERRLKKPFVPRWLQGFRCAEDILQATDHGYRFWRTSNVQTSALRISQSVIVGRAVILAQPMSPLPPPDEFDAAKEASRFGWLLYGTEKDMYQVHGGCGFSKKLLHILSQVTYCAARLHQDAESPVVPMTADYIYRELLNMRQWSPESRDWETAKTSTAVIEWVCRQPPGYKIDENSTMTDVTAEAWRIAAKLYLLSRVFRLPRNHPDIVSNSNDLAQCITIMPTSGMQFTAQAPLLPVFLLGILATLPEHRAVSQKWFDEVLQTPVRSSVPPLYKVLKNIWGWIDIDFPPLLPPNFEAAQPIHLRHAWWERLVAKVQDQEQEFLCLT
ncbi:hypothetical protein E4U21_007248 [Claviceps maximensis]|nr:hypothetical protein E4U21_007248 [Claviceps maximensis]